MTMYKEIRLSGTGGQGLILAGLILAEAAGVYDDHEVIQTQSYGPEARGGASRAEVIISDDAIDYPKVTSPDVVLIMSQQACDRYGSQVKPGGIVLVDETNVSSVPSAEGATTVTLPITEMARHDVGRQVVANVVALGALVGVTGVVTPEAMEKAILARVPKGTEELNMKAFNVGLERGRGARV
ncbi:MAG: 2-oxoacid:ferredoxin oxidoreductase subunit gamma [Firmicutes bacterium]|jgi:2-oxoglutarate ferredoxin oxidoreductase subunit gamma|nr:2-oxoacid:ferredoxin oxidoreductase subunit gamma [Bacillota bacterium]